MTNYKLISLYLCNDEDFICCSDKLLIESIYDCILYHNIVDNRLIDDIKLINYASFKKDNDTDLGLSIMMN